MRPRRRRRPPQEYDAFEKKLWRVVEGAIADTLRSHPDYVTKKGKYDLPSSLAKRVVGTINSYVKTLGVGSPGHH